jgi:hypothetical protein
MKHIFKTEIPDDSVAKKSLTRIDYKDAFGFYVTNPNIQLNDVARAFFTTAPKWIIQLMKFRDTLGRMVGLKSMGEDNKKPDFNTVTFLPGESYGLFHVLEHYPKEIIMGTDDKHLNFRVSIYLPETFDDNGRKKVVISTIVEMHNSFGRFYIKLVIPFHRLVVPAMLKNIYKALNFN